jgi:hypothetical protein
MNEGSFINQEEDKAGKQSAKGEGNRFFSLKKHILFGKIFVLYKLDVFLCAI